MGRLDPTTRDLTSNIRAVLLDVCYTNAFGNWHRATRNGQRVTLAALWRAGVLERREWRKGAHEYVNPVYVKRGLVSRELPPSCPLCSRSFRRPCPHDRKAGAVGSFDRAECKRGDNE